MNLTAWAIKWNIPYAAVDDLRREMGMVNTDPAPEAGRSESAVQSLVRLEASRLGARLWRNNRGAAHTENGFVRFGLANDTDKLNAQIKSSDLIGIRPVLIGPEHIGRTLGVFLSREIKEAGWHYTGTSREKAQLRWIELINSLGGDACFSTGEGTL